MSDLLESLSKKAANARSAHELISHAYKLLLTTVEPHEEWSLDQKIERLEDWIEKKHSSLALAIAEERREARKEGL